MTITPQQPSPDWNMVELRWAGTYLDGRPAGGKIVLTYNATTPLLDDGPLPVSVFPVRIDVPITTANLEIGGQTRTVGYASVLVPASNDPDIAGSGGTYQFTEALGEGVGRKSINFVADMDAPDGVIWINKLPGTGSTPATPYPVVYFSDLTSTPLTLANKRIPRRVHEVTTAASYALNADLYDGVDITAQAGPLELADPTGTPTRMQSVLVRIRDDGTSRPITYSPAWRATPGVIRPTATVPGRDTVIGAVWARDGKFDVVAATPPA